MCQQSFFRGNGKIYILTAYVKKDIHICNFKAFMQPVYDISQKRLI